MLKKLTQTAVLTALLSTGAYAYESEKKFCVNIDQNMKDIFNKSAINLDRIEQSKKDSNSNMNLNTITTINGCKIAMTERIGIDYNFTLKSMSGDVYNNTTTSFCNSIQSYIDHVNQKYKRTDDINILYNTFSYMLRVDKGNYQRIKKVFDNNPLYSKVYSTAVYGSTKKSNKKGISAIDFVYSFFQEGNKSSTKGVGYNDPKFRTWLEIVLSGDFNKADQHIEKEITHQFLTYEKGMELKVKKGFKVYDLESKSYVKVQKPYSVVEIYSNGIMTLFPVDGNYKNVIAVKIDDIKGKVSINHIGKVRNYLKTVQCFQYTNK